MTLSGIALFCLIGGAAFAIWVDTLAAMLREAYQLSFHPDLDLALAPYEPALSRALVGMLLAGFGSFILWVVVVRRFAAMMLKNLTSLLRDRKLLPYKYKAPLKESLASQQDKIFNLMEHYVDTLSEVSKDKKRYQEALDVYADPTVSQGMARGKKELLNSQRRNVAILFSDIRGFTSMSERLKPEQVVAVLNDYFMFSTEAISANHGKINKFIGDAVMAVFEDRPHAEKGNNASRNAIAAGLAMAERYHQMVPVWQGRAAAEISSAIGIGIAYGPAVMGNLGSKERMEYTAIGDTVNFAARLCGLAAGKEVRVSEDAFDLVRDYYVARTCDPVAVKGKTGLFTTYSILGAKGAVK